MRRSKLEAGEAAPPLRRRRCRRAPWTPAATTALDEYELNLVYVFRPLDLDAGEFTLEYHTDPSCVADTDEDGLDECVAGTAMDTRTAYNQVGTTSTCFVPHEGSTNPDYTDPNEPSDPCFYSAAKDTELSSGTCSGMAVQESRFAATYDPLDTPTRLIDGVTSAFVTESAAGTCTIENDNLCNSPLTLYEMLDESDGCGEPADRDSFEGSDGWWFYNNFTAERVEWTE